MIQILDLRTKIESLMIQNERTGVSSEGYEYFFTCPNGLIYRHQWFWDSCFHIMINSQLGRMAQAQKELDSLLYHQTPAGFIGHMNYWDPKPSLVDKFVRKYYPKGATSPLIQPAFIVHALNSLAPQLNQDQLIKYLKKISKYYDWLSENRVYQPESNSLITIIHPWESGMDNNCAYDPILHISGKFILVKWFRQLLKILKTNNKQAWDFVKIVETDHFAVEDPLVNSVYAEGLKILSQLWNKVGETELEEKYSNQAQKVEQAISQSLWDEDDGFFYCRKAYSHNLSKIKTVAGLSPLILDTLTDEKRRKLIEHLLNPNEFWTPYPIPSTAVNEKGFTTTSKLLWRGPSWVSTNWYIWKGLLKKSDNQSQSTANEISEKTLLMIEKEGFREFYDPFTSKGHGANGLGWSALIYLMIKNQIKNE
jgi:mannosylglycerate hydrolase MGH1-like protein